MTMDHTVPHGPVDVLKSGRRAAPASGSDPSWSTGFVVLWLAAAAAGAVGVWCADNVNAAVERYLMMWAGATAPASIIEPDEAAKLARGSLMRLGDAVRTKNFAIFRATASSAFQSQNSEQDLAVIFAWLKQENVSLSAAADLAPDVMQPAILEENRRLLLRGALQDGEQSLNFDLLYEPEADAWQLFGVAIYRD
jgi:hypothetical protein